MKWTALLLLISFTCSHASGTSSMCKPVDSFLRKFLGDSDENFINEVDKYIDNENGKSAAAKIRQCVDNLKEKEKTGYFKLAEEIMKVCEQSCKE